MLYFYFTQTKLILEIIMDEQVREWVKKKLQTISEGESVLSQSTSASITVPTPPSIAAPTPSPAAEHVQEEPEKVEKEIEVKKEVKKEHEVKQRPEIEQPINGSVDVEEKISEYVQKVVDGKEPVAYEPAVKEGLPVEEPGHSEEFSIPKMPKLSERRPGLFTKRRILIMMISSVAGIVAGYLVFLFLIS